MKRLLTIFMLFLVMTTAIFAGKKRPPDGAKKDVHIKTYQKKNGTIVHSHDRRSPK